MTTNFIGVLLPNSPSYTVNTGFSTQLYDATGAQTINVQSGASLSLVGSIGANTVRLSGNSSSWQVYRDGSTAILMNADGSRVELAASTTSQTLQFDNQSLGLSITTTGGVPSVMLGSQSLTTSVTAIGGGNVVTPPVGTGSTTKAPWTLLMHAGTGFSNAGIFVSDGSAAGTDLKTLAGWNASFPQIGTTGVRFVKNQDSSSAYFYNIAGYSSGSSTGPITIANKVGISNGTISGTNELISGAPYSSSGIPSTFATVVDNRLIMAGDQSSGTSSAAVLVSDGTVSGTTLSATDFPVHDNSLYGAISDLANRVVWFAANSAPYGIELVKFSYAAGSSPTTVLVKDINQGSNSSLNSFTATLSGGLLANGKLVFAANDGVNGDEPWVSDGTAAGTYMLASVFPMSINYTSRDFQTFGSKVVFSASISSVGTNTSNSPGVELIFTDGTASGTKVLDINPDGSSNPVFVGQANGLMYFTATTGPISAQGASTQKQSIFSTDGETFTRLADINSSASLLGWNADKAYFKVSDTTHGAELWAADLTNGGFELVKDILPGSGSSLAAYNFNINPFMVGGKLAFNAYTSATQQALFISDGSDTGTVQVSASLPSISKVVGSTLVFANAEGVFSVNASQATPTATQLVSAANTGGTNNTMYPNLFASTGAAPWLMQTDSDQVFFRTNNGDLYASNGTASGTIKLAGGVNNFKVVAENAIFFVEKSAASTSNAALWYSDGTAVGTRLVEALPESMGFDMENAVAIVTVGVVT